MSEYGEIDDKDFGGEFHNRDDAQKKAMRIVTLSGTFEYDGKWFDCDKAAYFESLPLNWNMTTKNKAKDKTDSCNKSLREAIRICDNAHILGSKKHKKNFIYVYSQDKGRWFKIYLKKGRTFKRQSKSTKSSSGGSSGGSGLASSLKDFYNNCCGMCKVNKKEGRDEETTNDNGSRTNTRRPKKRQNSNGSRTNVEDGNSNQSTTSPYATQTGDEDGEGGKSPYVPDDD